MKRIPKYLSLFLTGFIQVLFISCNVCTIANNSYIGSFTSSILISLVWCYNIKRINVASKKDIFFYCIGSGIGNITGMYLTSLFI